MSEPDVLAKDPPPLGVRSKPPQAMKMRGAVVRGVAVAAGLLVSGALAWAFVVQPELRHRRDVGGEAVVSASGVVRPSQAVTEQPSTYERLPEPRVASRIADDPGPVRVRVTPAARIHAPAVSDRPQEVDAQALAVRSSLFFDGGGLEAATNNRREGEDGWNLNRLQSVRSPYEIKAGAILPAVLLTAVDTSRSGPVVATVSQAVPDTVTGHHLLIPAGARLIGRHEGENRHGDRRAFLVWDRLILPNGKSLMLGGEPGVDAQGATGVRGRTERRLGSLVTSVLLGGAITALGQAARDDDSSGWLGDAGDAASIEAAQVGGRLIDRELQVRPVIQLGVGTPVRVLLTRDLVLEPYQP